MEVLNQIEEVKYLTQFGAKLYDNIIPIIKDLSKSYKLFIVSNCQKGYIESFLEHYNLTEFFLDTECNGNTNKLKEENGLPKVESFENLYNIVRKQNSENKDSQKNVSLLEDSVNSTLRENNDYSKTNNQVEGVEEADIVKTDGKYIYYITGKKLVIVNAVEATNMKIASEIKSEEEQIEPKEIFINGNRLIIVEQKYEYNGQINENSVMDDMIYPSDEYTNIKVYNIEDKNKPVMEREIQIEGSYLSSRMVGENVYVLSNKYIYSELLEKNKEELNEKLEKERRKQKWTEQ